jgi:hypothetical protein
MPICRKRWPDCFIERTLSVVNGRSLRRATPAR